jgi:serine phosphatase RsbU (regulator of sigma subunit)
MAVRYVPAAREAEVGGDWYDVFLQPDGGTVLIIGDVVGHDIEAAAVMGQLRGLLRGIAYDTDAGPAEVLSRLDRAVAGLRLDAMASVLVARLDQTDAERERGVSRVVWSNAGHLPPVVLLADGSTGLLDAGTPDLLLGVHPGVARQQHEAVVARGSTVLLYTDGLVERRDQLFDEGITALRRRLTARSGQPVEELLDGLLTDLVPGRTEDDVALVAVRLHEQDRPRPDR